MNSSWIFVALLLISWSQYGKLYELRLPWLDTSVDNGCTEDDECFESYCEFLPPANSTDPLPDADLFTILDDGLEIIDAYPESERGVVLLGNTGAGKTTVAHIIAGDLEKIHSVCSTACSFVIIDDDDRIGGPSTKSKTLVPELFQKHMQDGSTLPFYDCPGFDDTRGPVHDMSANFFVNAVTKKMSQVKLLLVVNFSSFVAGESRSDFDNLATHVVKFVKNIEKFLGSFGLIANKATNYNSNGRWKSDTSIINDIVTFLAGYINDLKEEIQKNPNNTEAIGKLSFASVLMDHDNTTGNYTRIWFIRKPTDCGALSELSDMVFGRSNISDMVDRLEYINIEHATDFGFTLADSTKLEVAVYVKTANADISLGIAKMSNELVKNYNESVRDLSWRSMNWKGHNEARQYVAANLTKLTKEDLCEITEGEDFLSLMSRFFEQMDFPMPSDFKDFLSRQTRYVSFFEVVTEKSQADIRGWGVTLVQFSENYGAFNEFYQLCEEMATNLTSYNFQTIRDTLPEPTYDGDWYDYTRRNGIIHNYNFEKIDTGKTMTLSEQNLLFDLLEYVINDKIMVSCQNDTKTIQIVKNFLRISDIWPLQQVYNACPDVVDARQVNIYIGHTLFHDKNEFAVVDRNMVILAPKLVSHEAKSKFVSLLGLTGFQSISSAESGAERDEQPGGTGRPGCKGGNGNPSGSLFTLIKKIYGFISVQIQHQPGSGGNGQKGGNGGRGRPKDASSGRDKAQKQWSNSMTCYKEHYGFNGKNGGDGGVGGKKGLKGTNGTTSFIYIEDSLPVTVTLVPPNDGMDGQGGSGGQGSRIGKGYRCSWVCCPVPSVCLRTGESCSHPNGKNKQPGRDGGQGTSGVSTALCADHRDAKNLGTISEWYHASIYRFIFSTNMSRETQEFINSIDNNEKTRHLWNLKSLSEEALLLETVGRKTMQMEHLASLYSSLIVKLQVFKTDSFSLITEEHRKILFIILSRAHTSKTNLNSSKEYQLVVNIGDFLQFVTDQLKSYHSSSALVAVQTTERNFNGKIQEKIGQCLNFTDEVVNPKLTQIEGDVEALTEEVEVELDKMIQEAKITLEELRNRLKDEKLKSRFLQIFSIGGLLSGLLPGNATKYTGGFNTIINVFKEIYSNQKTVVAKLEQMAKEAEALVHDLETKREYFVTEVVPLINPLMEYFRNVSQELRNGGNVSSPHLAVTKWQLTAKLTECKNKMEPLKDTTGIALNLVQALDGVMETMTLSITLYDLIEQYIDTQSMASYMAAIHSTSLQPIPIVDPDYTHLVANYDMHIKKNLLMTEVKRAMTAFYQWVFPFAHLYTAVRENANYTKLIQTRLDDEPELEQYLMQIELLNSEIRNYKSSIIPGQDTFIISTNFSSGFTSSAPFYVWNATEWVADIQKLLTGEEVIFFADVRKYKMQGRDAIKFKQIEFNFRLNNATQDEQDEFDELLPYFGVIMTHAGLSSYRFFDDYYTMNGSPQTLRYNFERDSNGNRLGTNAVYEKFKTGDLMMSPYAHWKVKLILVVPKKRSLKFKGEVDFTNLQKFVANVDLELCGMGTYVDGMSAAAAEDLKVSIYYDRDTRPTPKWQ